MTETSIDIPQTRVENLRWTRRCSLLLLACGTLMFAGCTHVPPQQQRLVSKPNMQFSSSAIFNYQDKLLSQFESGSASSVGGRSSDCGSCVAGGGTMKKPVHIYIILVLSFLLLSENMLCAWEKAPLFKLPRLGTKTQVSLDDFQGKIIVLDFFSASCGECFRASFELELGVQELYADRSGNRHGVPVQVVAISSEVAEQKDMNAFLEETGMDMILDDSEGNLLKRYGRNHDTIHSSN